MTRHDNWSIYIYIYPPEAHLRETSKDLKKKKSFFVRIGKFIRKNTSYCRVLRPCSTWRICVFRRNFSRRVESDTHTFVVVWSNIGRRMLRGEKLVRLGEIVHSKRNFHTFRFVSRSWRIREKITVSCFAFNFIVFWGENLFSRIQNRCCSKMWSYYLSTNTSQRFIQFMLWSSLWVGFCDEQKRNINVRIIKRNTTNNNNIPVENSLVPTFAIVT